MQNLLAHWVPKFMVDSFNDLVHKPGEPNNTLGTASVHTSTYKDSLQKLAPTIAKHLDRYYVKEKACNEYGQHSFYQYKQLAKEESSNVDDIRDFIGL